MYLAYKTARKKYKAHQEQKAAQQQEQTAYTGPDAQDVAYPNNTYPPPATYTQGVFIPNADPSLTPSPANPDKKDAKSKEETPEQIAEKKRRRKYRLKLLLGLFAPFALSALDTTIIASALKFIAEDFSQFPLFHSFPSPSFPPSHVHLSLSISPPIANLSCHLIQTNSPN